MKTKLPKQSLVIKERLAEITEALLVSKNQIAMIILFGSYAKGTWVRDYYMEGQTRYSYESDLDILVVTKNPKHKGLAGARFASELERRLERKNLRGRVFGAPWVKIIVDSIKYVNEQLEKSQYFFSDITKEGIMLYDSGEFKLAKAKDLSWSERKEMSVAYFNKWFPRGKGFLRSANYAIRDKDLSHAAFYLHQATESFYTAILLVFTGYKEKIHDIEILGSLASNYSNELLKIFPRNTKELDDMFILLKKAYIDARYSDNYVITEEQLFYLISRVKKLKEVTEQICTAWINQPELNA